MNKLLILIAFTLSGCLGMTPALAGKTHYNVEFVDQTEEQNTQYKMNIKAPAGVDLSSVTGMSYKWSPDGSGDIAVSSDSTVDTTVQAETLLKMNEQLVAVVNALLAVQNED